MIPLDKTKLNRIAVIGPLADKLVTNNYNGKTGKTVTPLQGIKDRAAPGAEILYSRGCDVTKSADASAELAAAAKATDQISTQVSSIQASSSERRAG